VYGGPEGLGCLQLEVGAFKAAWGSCLKAWRRKVRHVPGFDEIDASVLEALPPEIREEAAGTPLKRQHDCAVSQSAGHERGGKAAA